MCSYDQLTELLQQISSDRFSTLKRPSPQLTQIPQVTSISTSSIILPAHNEEGAIESVIQSIRQTVPSAEIIVIDDGSTDSTRSIAEKMDVRVIHHPLRLGAGRSVKDGIEAASNEHIVMLDCDATYPAESIPALLRKLDEGYHLAVGARRGKYYWSSLPKTIGRICFRLLSEFATGKRIPDINSGMRAFRKSEMMAELSNLSDKFSFPTTMTLVYLFRGKQIAYIPIGYHKRIGVSKVRIIHDSLRALQYITELVLAFNPIKIFLLIAILTLIIGVIIGFWQNSAMYSIFSLFLSILIFSLGLFAQKVK